MVEGTPESLDLPIPACMIVTCSKSVDSKGGLEVVDDFEGKSIPRSVVISEQIVTKCILLFMKNRNARVGSWRW